MKTADGKRLDPSVQLGAAVIEAALSSAVEVGTEFGPVLEMMGPLGKMLQGAEGKTLRRELLQDVAWRSIMRKVGAAWAKGQTAEGGEEGVQAAISEGAAYLARVTQGALDGGAEGASREAERFDLQGSLSNIGTEAAGGFVAMTGQGAIGAGVNLATRSVGRRRALQSAAIAETIAQGADSPTAVASPDGYASLVQAQTQRYGQRVDALYADEKETLRLFQGDGPETEAGVLTQEGAAAAREVLGEAGPTRLAEALATGSRLRLELSEMVGIARRPELQKALLDHLAIAPGIPTQAELAKQDVQINAEAQAIDDRYHAEQEAVADQPLLPEEKFFEALEEQAVVAGRMTAAEAKRTVMQARAFLRTMAATASKNGPVPLQEMVDRYRTRIETEFGVVPTQAEATVAAEAQANAPGDAVEAPSAAAARLAEAEAKLQEAQQRLASIGRAQQARSAESNASGRVVLGEATAEEAAAAEQLRGEIEALRQERSAAEVAAAEEADTSFDPALFQEDDAVPAASAKLEADYAAMTPDQQVRTFYTDRLTGLLNARAFAALPSDPGRPMVGEIEIEGAKEINEVAGHDGLNKVYRAVAGELVKLVPDASKVGGSFRFQVKDAAELGRIVEALNAAVPTGFRVSGVSVARAENQRATFDALGVAHTAHKEDLVKKRQLAARGKLPLGLRTKKAARAAVAALPGTPVERAAIPEALAAAHPTDPAGLADAAGQVYVEESTRLLTNEGWGSIPRKAHIASFDLRGLKKMNEVFQRDGADRLLRAFGDLVASMGGAKFDAAHLHGDEYAAQADSREELDAFMLKVRQEAALILRVERMSDGSAHVQDGLFFAYGLGPTYDEADAAIAADKAKLPKDEVERRTRVFGTSEADRRELGDLVQGREDPRHGGAGAADAGRGQRQDVSGVARRVALKYSASSDPKQLQVAAEFWRAAEESAAVELAKAQAEVEAGGDDAGARRWKAKVDEARAQRQGVQAALSAGATFQDPAPGPVWHSAAVKAARAAKQEKGPAASWWAVLTKAPGVKLEELELMGLKAWLDGQKGSVTRKQVVDFAEAHQVKLEEVELGKAEAPMRFNNLASDLFDRGFLSKWNGPDDAPEFRLGSGPWEELQDAKQRVAAAAQAGELEADEARELEQLLEMADEAAVASETESASKYESYTLGGHKAGTYRELLITMPGLDYASGHFGGQRGYLAHARLSEHQGAGGVRVLMVEEIQSDLHQEGRDKGYSGDAAARKLVEQRKVDRDADGEAYDQFSRAMRAKYGNVWYAKATQEERGEQSRLSARAAASHALWEASKLQGEGPPDAPWKASWEAMVVRRIVRYAAEHGFGQVAWSTGEQQAERYDLGGKVNAIEYVRLHPKDGEVRYDIRVQSIGGGYIDNLKPSYSVSELEGLVGKEIARKIDSGDAEKGTLEGVDLHVGGDGMKAAYDQRIPGIFKKLVGKWGGEVKRERVGETTEDRARSLYEATHQKFMKQPWAELDDKAKAYFTSRVEEAPSHQVWTASLPEALRKEVLAEGVPLFAGEEQPTGPRGWSRRVRDGVRNLFRIILTKDSNLSTFLHESGHVYFEILGDLAAREDASERVKAQWAEVLQFTGLKDLADVQARMDGALAIDKAALQAGRVKQNGLPDLTTEERAARRELVEPLEKFARAFEAYLMEGKAPSPTLVAAFQAFRLWLLDIYKSVAGLRVELNDEIRRTFDTMLATDEEIARMRGFVDPEAPFRSPEEAGMTGEEWAEHLKAREAAVSHAAMALQAKALKARKRELDTWWRAEWKKRHAAALEAHAQLPAVRLAAWLRTGESENPVLRSMTEGVRAAARFTFRPFRMKYATQRAVKVLEKEISELERQAYAVNSFGDQVATAEERAALEAQVLALREKIVERIGLKEVEAATAKAAPKIPLQLAVAVLGPEKAKETLRGLTNRSAWWTPAVDMALVAQLLGFESPEEMVKALAERPDRDSYAQEQADDAMAREFSEVAGERSWVSRQAAVELHGDEMLQWMLREWDILRKRMGAEEGQRLEELGVGSGGMPGEAVRRAAMQIVARRAVGRLDPGQVLRAEQAAANAVIRAVARKDYAQAYVFMQQRLLNYHLYRELATALEDRAALESLARDLRKDAARARLGKANPAYRDAVDQVLEKLGLGGPYQYDVQPASIEAAVEAMEQDGATIGFDATEIGRLVQNPPDAPVGVNGKLQAPWKALTVAQVREVIAALQGFRAAATARNTAILRGKRVDKEGLLVGLVAEASENLPDRGEVSSSVTAEGLLEQLGGAASAFDGDLLRIETMVRWLGGGKTESLWVQALIQPLRDAKHREADLLRETIAPIVKAMDAMPAKVRAQLAERVDGRKLFPYHISKIAPPTRRFEILMMLLNMGNDSNKERLLKGRGISEQQVLEAAKTIGLTGAELDWVQAVWDAAESLWPLARALEERDSGLPPPKIQAVPLVVNGRTLRGGYFPAAYDRRVSGTGEMQAGDTIAAMLDPTYTRPGTHRSHLKKRAARFDDVIALDPSVIQSHLWQVAHDIAFREAVRSVAGIILDRGSEGRPAIKDVLVRRLGEKRGGYFLQWIKDVASHRGAQTSPHARGMTRFFGWARQNATVGLLGYAADIAVGDLANVPTAYAKFQKEGMESKYLVAGIGAFMRHPITSLAEARKRSGELRSRASDAMEQWKQTKSALLRNRSGARVALKAWDAFLDNAFVFFEITEALTATPVWVGAYRWGIAKGKSEAEAVRHADHIVASLLPPRHPMDMPAVMRDKGLVGGVTFLHGYLNTMFNVRRDIVHDAYLATHASELEGGAPDLRKDSAALFKAIPGIAWRLVALVAAYQVLGEFLTGRGAGDEDRDKDRDLEDWALWFLRKMLAGLTVNDLPFGPLAEPIITKAVTGKASRISARQAPGLSVVVGLGEAAMGAWSGDELGADEAYDIMRALGVALGVPTRPLRSVDYVRRAVAGETEVRGPGDALGGVVYGERSGGPANPFTAAQDLAE